LFHWGEDGSHWGGSFIVSLRGFNEVETIQKKGRRKRIPRRIRATRENQGTEERDGFMVQRPE
jgi:hypothetical protein